MGPGTAMTSPLRSSAWRAVISEPLRSRASTMTTADAMALIRRFRSGKKYGSGRVGIAADFPHVARVLFDTSYSLIQLSMILVAAGTGRS